MMEDAAELHRANDIQPHFQQAGLQISQWRIFLGFPCCVG